jgi:hypothetical protein
MREVRNAYKTNSRNPTGKELSGGLEVDERNI